MAVQDVSDAHTCIIGGGISGLAVAYYLTAAGKRVTLIESSAELGGLGTWFEYRSKSLERFYHCMLPSDKHLLSLLDDLELTQHTYWKNTSFGFMHEGSLYGLNTPLELLKFSPLPFTDRLRVGFTGLWGSIRSAKGLDNITCAQWLTTLSGKRAFDTFWKPMLQAKFGDRYQEVPALWFWTRFNREKGGNKKEQKGYIEGGYRRIVEKLYSSLVARGATIHLNTPIEKITFDSNNCPTVTHKNGQETFDKLVYTAPISRLSELMPEVNGDISPQALGAELDMQGVVNAVIMLKRGFSEHYWVAAVDDEIPFQGLIESTTLLDQRETGGVHLIYLMNYIHRSDALFGTSDETILASYRDGLKRMFPDFDEADIIDQYVFRSPYVEPLYTLGYEQLKPAKTVIPNRFYLATTAQVYPQVTSWNGSVGLARDVANTLLNDDQNRTLQ